MPIVIGCGVLSLIVRDVPPPPPVLDELGVIMTELLLDTTALLELGGATTELLLGGITTELLLGLLLLLLGGITTELLLGGITIPELLLGGTMIVELLESGGISVELLEGTTTIDELEATTQLSPQSVPQVMIFSRETSFSNSILVAYRFELLSSGLTGVPDPQEMTTMEVATRLKKASLRESN